MALLKDYSNNYGFSFLEILITVVIVGFILTISLPIGWSFYYTYNFNSEVQTLVAVLESARNSAMVNRNESSHGVFIGANDFVLFQGPSYAARDTSQDKSFPRYAAITISGPTEIVFSALAGTTTISSFNIDHRQSSININVNSEGTILY